MPFVAAPTAVIPTATESHMPVPAAAPTAVIPATTENHMPVPAAAPTAVIPATTENHMHVPAAGPTAVIPATTETSMPLPVLPAAVASVSEGKLLSFAADAGAPAPLCVFYGRTASVDDADIDRQIDNCRRHAELAGMIPSKTGCVFVDSGRSGIRSEDSEALAALLAGAREKRFQIVIVDRLDRLSRDFVQCLETVGQLGECGVEVHVAGDGRVELPAFWYEGATYTPLRERMRELAALGRRRAVMAGRNVGKVPFGYRRAGETGTIRVDECEAAIVRRIFGMFDDGNSAVDIARILNSEGVPSPEAGPWKAATIRGRPVDQSGLLRNPRYVGTLVHGRRFSIIEGGRKRFGIRRPEDWTVVQVAAWEIVPRPLWTRVALRLQAAESRRSVGR